MYEQWVQIIDTKMVEKMPITSPADLKAAGIDKMPVPKEALSRCVRVSMFLYYNTFVKFLSNFISNHLRDWMLQTSGLERVVIIVGRLGISIKFISANNIKQLQWRFYTVVGGWYGHVDTCQFFFKRRELQNTCFSFIALLRHNLSEFPINESQEPYPITLQVHKMTSLQWNKGEPCSIWSFNHVTTTLSNFKSNGGSGSFQ